MTTGDLLRKLTLKALRAGLTNSCGGAGRQLAPFHLLAALPCRVRGAVAEEVVPHGVTHTAVEAGVDLMKTKWPRAISIITTSADEESEYIAGLLRMIK